jgi:hypothetical protein
MKVARIYTRNVVSAARSSTLQEASWTRSRWSCRRLAEVIRTERQHEAGQFEPGAMPPL